MALRAGAPGTSGFSENSSRVEGLPSPFPSPASLLPHSQASQVPQGLPERRLLRVFCPLQPEEDVKSVYYEKCPHPNNKNKRTPVPSLAGLSTGHPWYQEQSQDEESWKAGTRALGGFSGSQLLSGKLKEPSLSGRQRAEVPLSFREKGCFKVTLSRAGLSQVPWNLWHEKTQEYGK